jgi:hypothetical protein
MLKKILPEKVQTRLSFEKQKKLCWYFAAIFGLENC